MTRNQLFTAFFFAVLALLLYQVYEVFSVFLSAFAWAAVLALVFYPAYNALLHRIGRPAVASAAMTVLIGVIVSGPVFGFGGVAVRQARHFYDTVQQKVRSGEARAWIDRARETRVAQLATRTLPPDLRESIDLEALGLRGAQAATQYLVSQVGEIARNVVGFLVNFLLMLVLLFFFFRDGHKLYLSFRDLVPMEVQHKDAIFARFYGTLSAVVQGMTATAVAQGLLAGVAFWVLDLPFALLLALASALASFVPITGAALVWFPAAVYFLLQGSWGRALALFLWGTLVISLVDNILKPLIIGSRTKIPTVFLFFGVLGGLRAYGAIGVFLGPVLLATIVAFLKIYQEEYGTGGDSAG